MSASLFQDLISRLATHATQTAEPEGKAEPGVRLVEGELQYSDEWLDHETSGPFSVDASDANPEEDEESR